MKQDVSKLLQKKKKNILEDWVNLQLADAGLREDLMSNDELREQSRELLDALLQAITEQNLPDFNSEEYNVVYEIISGISISRARQGFSPRETGVFVFSLKDAILKTLITELSNDREWLTMYMYCLRQQTEATLRY